MGFKRFPLSAPLALACLSLWGCGGGSSSSDASGGSALTRAETQINNLSSGLQPTNDATLTAALSLFNAALQRNPNSQPALLGQAMCQAGLAAGTLETDSGLPISMATTGTGSVSAANLATSTGQTTPATPGDQPYAASLAPPASRLGLLWQLGAGAGNPYTLLTPLAPVANLRYGLIPLYGYAGDDVANRQQALQQLNAVTQTLQKLEADPNFATTLIIVGSPRGGSKVGLPELYLFDAYVNSLRAQLALSLAYNRDPGINNPLSGPPLRPVELEGGSATIGGVTGNMNPSPGLPATGASYGSLDKNGDGKLTPDEYLPASPFLTLSDANMLQTARQALQAAADKEAKGIQGVFTRPSNGSGGFLINNVSDTPPSVNPVGGVLIANSNVTHDVLDNTLTSVVPLLQQAVKGPVALYVPNYEPATPGYVYTVSYKSAGRQGGGGNRPGGAPTRRAGRRVFLLGYAGNGVDDGNGAPPTPLPASSVKATINLAAWFANPPADLKAFAPTYTLDSGGFVDFTKTTYPDPTFGGLFPNGLPDELLL